MLQKAYAEGMRALVTYTACFQDELWAAEMEGRDASQADRINDLLLPIVKGVGSERSYEMLAQSLQTFGGSGFLQDYPIEQYIRDAKIDTLYEGTTAIQGLDLFFRKIVRDQGQAISLPRRADPGVRQGRRRQRHRSPSSASCSARRSRTSRASSAPSAASR